MTVSLVTGGAGFIGSHLVDALLARGDRVLALDDESTGSAENLQAARAHPRFQFARGSAADAALLASLLNQADEVYHLAAAVGVALVAREPVRSIETNILPTQVVLEAMRQAAAAGKRQRLFFAGTSEVYGKNPRERWSETDDLVFGPTTKPRWSYGVSKAIDEFLVLGAVRSWGLPAVIGRFFNVVGPRQSGAYGMVLPRFVDAALSGRPLLVHDDGTQIRCFAHVADIVPAVMNLVRAPQAVGEVFNIGSDQPVSIRRLAERVIAQCESPSPIEHQSYAAAYDADFEDIRCRIPDLTKIRQTLNYQPRYDLDAMIRDVIAWRRTPAAS